MIVLIILKTALGNVQCETDEGVLEKPLMLYLSVNIIKIILRHMGSNLFLALLFLKIVSYV